MSTSEKNISISKLAERLPCSKDTSEIILLSPIFDTMLWESYCNFVKMIPVAMLQGTVTIGFILLVIALFLELAGKRRN